MRRSLVLLLLLSSAAAGMGLYHLAGRATAGPDDVPRDAGAGESADAGGSHWRLDTVNGPVHVWTPAGYEHDTAGIVVYVHGYYTDVDEAWKRHKLAAQFAASGRNALFIVPEAPVRGYQDVFWHDLGDLLREVGRQIAEPRPWGPLVVMGHSGAYRTLMEWLAYRPLDHVIMIDALYANEKPFAAWFAQARGGEPTRLTMVSMDTLRWSELFASELGTARTLDWVPEHIDDVDPGILDARFVYIRSQFGHMELVTEGKTIPLLLRMTRLPAVASAAAGTMTGAR